MKIKFFLSFLLSTVILFSHCAPQEESKKESLQGENLKPQSSFEGRIVFQSNMDGDNEIYLMTKNEVLKLTDNTWEDKYPVWSPDGKKIAFTANPRGNYEIFIMDGDGSHSTQVTFSEDDETEPSWFPDGKDIVYTTETKKLLKREVALYRLNLESGKSKKAIPQYSNIHGIAHISPISPLMTFTSKRRIGWDVAIYDLREKKIKYLNEGGNSCRARFSKDGIKLAYVSSQADRKGDIWLMNPDGSGKLRLTLRDNTYDYFPSWAPDGKHIVFSSSSQHDLDGDWALYIIDVESQKPLLLFDSPGNDIFPDWYK